MYDSNSKRDHKSNEQIERTTSRPEGLLPYATGNPRFFEHDNQGCKPSVCGCIFIPDYGETYAGFAPGKFYNSEQPFESWVGISKSKTI